VLQRQDSESKNQRFLGKALLGATWFEKNERAFEQLRDLQTAFLRTAEMSGSTPDVVCFANEPGEDPAERTWIVLIQIKYMERPTEPWSSMTVAPDRWLTPADVERLGVKRILQLAISWTSIRLPEKATRKTDRNASNANEKYEIFQAVTKVDGLREMTRANFSSAFQKRGDAASTETRKGKEPDRD
jgi:hypothetical protein